MRIANFLMRGYIAGQQKLMWQGADIMHYLLLHYLMNRLLVLTVHEMWRVSLPWLWHHSYSQGQGVDHLKNDIIVKILLIVNPDKLLRVLMVWLANLSLLQDRAFASFRDLHPSPHRAAVCLTLHPLHHSGLIDSYSYNVQSWHFKDQFYFC